MFSHLSNSGRPAIDETSSGGVQRAMPLMRSRAARISSMVTSPGGPRALDVGVLGVGVLDVVMGSLLEKVSRLLRRDRAAELLDRAGQRGIAPRFQIGGGGEHDLVGRD